MPPPRFVLCRRSRLDGGGSGLEAAIRAGMDAPGHTLELSVVDTQVDGEPSKALSHFFPAAVRFCLWLRVLLQMLCLHHRQLWPQPLVVCDLLRVSPLPLDTHSQNLDVFF